MTSNYYDLGKQTVLKYQNKINRDVEMVGILNDKTTLENIDSKQSSMNSLISDNLFKLTRDMDLRYEKTIKSLSKQYVKNAFVICSTIEKTNKALMELLQKTTDDRMEDNRVNMCLLVRAEYVSMYQKMLLMLSLHKAKLADDDARHAALLLALEQLNDQHKADIAAIGSLLTTGFTSLNGRLDGVKDQIVNLVAEVQKLDTFYRTFAAQAGVVVP
jgi:hypothetical protein